MGTHTHQPQTGLNVESLKRAPNKFATTNTTNAIAEALRSMFQAPHTSNANATIAGAPWAFLGRVTLTPPGGVADFADQRYWVVPLLIKEGPNGGIMGFSNDPESFEFDAVEVENLSERPALPDGNIGTHGLAEGTVVYVFAAYASDDDATLRFFTITGGGQIPVGQYTGMFLGVVANDTVGYAFPFAVTTV